MNYCKLYWCCWLLLDFGDPKKESWNTETFQPKNPWFFSGFQPSKLGCWAWFVSGKRRFWNASFLNQATFGDCSSKINRLVSSEMGKKIGRTKSFAAKVMALRCGVRKPTTIGPPTSKCSKKNWHQWTIWMYTWFSNSRFSYLIWILSYRIHHILFVYLR